VGQAEPRVFTPPLRELTEDTTLGFQVIRFAELLGLTMLPWQQWLLVHMLELLEDGTLRFRTVVVLVARQNGKSTLSQVLALWFMVVYGWPLVLGTAQDLETAEEVWQGAVDLLDEDDELKALIRQVVRVNGKKALVLTNGHRYKVKAANRRAGRGFSGNLVMLDELREHQTWDAWGAITKTTMARAEALVLALSNAGDASSIVLRYLRKMAHGSVGDPDGLAANDDPSLLLPSDAEVQALEDDLDPEDFEQDEDTLGIFEWSAAPGCDVWDRDAWAQANPSLGHTITERTIASAAKTDPEWVFRTEVLCQWSDGSLEGLFPPGTWENRADGDPPGCLDPGSSIPDGSGFVFAVDVSWDRSTSHVAAVGRRADGIPHVEIVATRYGTDWVVPWIAERARSDGLWGVALQSTGAPVSSLLPALRDALKDTQVPVLEWSGPDLGRGTGEFYDLVRSGGLRHLPQPVLDVAAATAVSKPLADAWVVNRAKSPVDAAPLIAVMAGTWAMLNHQEPVRSAYEDHEFVMI
jgi:hypothetical protein